MRWALAIDTSLAEGGLAVGPESPTQPPLSGTAWDASVSHDARLAADFQMLILQHGLVLNDLVEISIVVGPGRFTGLRVGIAFAKALAWSTGCSIRTILGDEIWAASTIGEVGSRARYIEDGQSGMIFSSSWLWRNHRWEREREMALLPIKEALANASDLANPGTLRWGTGWSLALPPNSKEAPVPRPKPGDWFAARHLLGQTKDWKSLEPLYFRRVAAEEKRDSRSV
jgi:tRNA threonylcarbamoyladenosine biosynthesis protein TsaB